MTPIPLQHQPDAERQACCFCRLRTRLVTALPGRRLADQLPCCFDCSRRALPVDLPEVRAYARREEVAFMRRHDDAPDWHPQLVLQPPQEPGKSEP